ncbi:hypothetical protein ACIO1C_13475 [Streptomyces sp. NPDC087420]|uniref:hypothetical protein n=1 Tax=Streptomyces sp. NPDC087420 TaxID=3365785 RepID=UPI0038335E86
MPVRQEQQEQPGAAAGERSGVDPARVAPWAATEQARRNGGGQKRAKKPRAGPYGAARRA